MPLNLETLKLNANQGAYGVIGSPHVLLLIEAVEALAEERKPRHKSPEYYHWETDEVTCICGFLGDSDDYETARKYLRSHIYYYERKEAKELQAIRDRADKALEAFVLPSA